MSARTPIATAVAALALAAPAGASSLDPGAGPGPARPAVAPAAQPAGTNFQWAEAVLAGGLIAALVGASATLTIRRHTRGATALAPR
jgi:hypothetical protein